MDYRKSEEHKSFHSSREIKGSEGKLLETAVIVAIIIFGWLILSKTI